jgi:hypothetical protein
VNEIILLRKRISQDVFDYQVLSDTLSAYRKPRDRITKLLESEVIIRIKKGLYCFSEDFRKEPVSREYLANLIYGPSYVSLDYALSYYGLIPERVNIVTSVTTKRSCNFHTPLGVFSYRMLGESRYSIGVFWEKAGNTPFLVASPEKALSDKVWTDKRFSGIRISDYGPYLSDDLRLDPGALGKLDFSRLEKISRAYDSAKIDNLLRYMTRERMSVHA